MQIIADLHIHSKYSRAVSQKMEILEIACWAKKKGIDLVATGDWTHPLWLREIKANLEEDGTGLLRLKRAAEVAHCRALRSPTKNFVAADRPSQTGANYVKQNFCGLPAPLFLLSTEISLIYSQAGKQRRIHNLVLAPSIAVAEKINQELMRKGANLASDGRPIIGLSAQELVELVLGIDENCLVIPAHIWTPWFSLFGSMSGFDSLDECFGKMSKYIYGIETGLSSSPEMNWRIKELDNRSILSFSDAHSGPKLGRETTVFQIKAQSAKRKAQNYNKKIKTFSYQDVALAIKNDPNGDFEVGYTLEFYPEEGKYHYTGHRHCQVRQSPEETKKLGRICPVCGKPLTVGVMHRVEQLAAQLLKTEDLRLKNDENGVRWISYQNRPPYVTLVPLLEILGEALESTPTSLKVQNEYENLTAKFEGEFGVLLKAKVDEIAKITGEKIAEGILRVRSGQVLIEPGYDGVFGKVKIWKEGKDGTEGKEGKEKKKRQLSLF